MILNLIYVYVINYVVIGMDFFLLTFHLFDKTLQQIGMLDPDAMDTKGIPLTCRYNTRSSRQPIFDPLELSSSLDQTRGSCFPFYIRQQLAGILMRSFVLLIAYNWQEHGKLPPLLTVSRMIAVCWCLELNKKILPRCSPRVSKYIRFHPER